MKRMFDLVIAAVLSPFAIVICFLAAIPVMIECRGWPIFVQTRLGQYERPFNLFKIRTMRKSTPSVATHEVNANNILSSGSFLRRLKIDELPQLVNVLIGTMSLVGPRPGLPEQRELTEVRRKKGVYDLVPGITGISQLKRIDMSTPELLALTDIEYLQPWSIRRDLGILFSTFTGTGNGDPAISDVK